MRKMLWPLVFGYCTCLCFEEVQAQRLEFFVENGVSMPIGNFSNPDIYYEGGDGASPGYIGQAGINYYFDRYFGLSVLATIQSNPYSKREIRNLYQGLSDGRFKSIDFQGYLLMYGMIGPNLRFKQDVFSFSFTPSVGYGYLDDNFVRFKIRNQVSENDVFVSRVDKNLGYTMGLKGSVKFNVNQYLHLGLSISYFRSAFNELKTYLYYRDSHQLESRNVIEKIEPQTINFLFRIGLRI